jgi:hypothetical protein
LYTFSTSHFVINDHCSLLQHYSFVSLTVAHFQYLTTCYRLPLCTFSTSQRGIVCSCSLSAPRSLESWTVVHGYNKCLQRVLLWLRRFEMAMAMAGTLIGWSGPSAFCLGPNINSRHPNRLVRAQGILRDCPSERFVHISFLCLARSDAMAAHTPRQLGHNASQTQRMPDATQARRNGGSDTTQVRHNAGQTQRNFNTDCVPPNDFDPNPYQSVFGVCPTLSCMPPESQYCLRVMLQRVSNLRSRLCEVLHLHAQARVSMSRSEGLHVATHVVHKVGVSMSQRGVSAK